MVFSSRPARPPSAGWPPRGAPSGCFSPLRAPLRRASRLPVGVAACRVSFRSSRVRSAHRLRESGPSGCFSPLRAPLRCASRLASRRCGMRLPSAWAPGVRRSKSQIVGFLCAAASTPHHHARETRLAIERGSGARVRAFARILRGAVPRARPACLPGCADARCRPFETALAKPVASRPELCRPRTSPLGPDLRAHRPATPPRHRRSGTDRSPGCSVCTPVSRASGICTDDGSGSRGGGDGNGLVNSE